MGFLGFGNTATMSGGGTSSGYSSMGGAVTTESWTNPTQTSTFTSSSAWMNAGQAGLSVAQGVMNTASYSSAIKSAKKAMNQSMMNMYAISENYKYNKWVLDVQAQKYYGAIINRTGEGGSALDLLQETAAQMGVEKWNLYNEYVMNSLKEYKNYRKAKAAKSKAKAGQIGSAIGTAAAVVSAPFTGGASLAFAGTASQIGGQIGSSLK